MHLFDSDRIGSILTNVANSQLSMPPQGNAGLQQMGGGFSDRAVLVARVVAKGSRWNSDLNVDSASLRVLQEVTNGKCGICWNHAASILVLCCLRLAVVAAIREISRAVLLN